MGRYYSGDIEGKFWFGVQSSEDGEFFGMRANTSFVDYYVDESDIDLIEIGIKDCKAQLRGHLGKLEKFFKNSGGYTNKQLSDVLNVNETAAHDLLVWYARLLLGRQIHECVLEEGACYMNAEM